MKHRIELVVIVGGFVLWAAFTAIAAAGPFFPPGYTWSHFANDWGTILVGLFIGGPGVIFAALNLRHMQQQIEANRDLQNREFAFKVAADVYDHLTDLNNFLRRADWLRVVAERTIREREEQAVATPEEESWVQYLNEMNLQIPNYPISLSLGYLPRSLQGEVRVMRALANATISAMNNTGNLSEKLLDRNSHRMWHSLCLRAREHLDDLVSFCRFIETYERLPSTEEYVEQVKANKMDREQDDMVVLHQKDTRSR